MSTTFADPDRPKFDITVKLVGTDGNAWALMGKVVSAMRDVGATKEQEKQFMDEAMSGDYDHLLRTCMAWVHVA